MRTPCPHCNKGIMPQTFQRHIGRCLENPDVQAKLAEALPDPDDPRYIRKSVEYQELAKLRPDLPSLHSIYKQVGPWPELAKRYNLVFTRKITGRKTIHPAEPTQRRPPVYGGEWPFKAIEGWRILPEWCPSRKKWVPAYAKQVFLLK